MSNRHAIQGVATIFALLLSGCGSPSANSNRGSRLGAVGVASVDNEYEPRDITLVVGQAVKWTNTGRNQHDIKIKKGPANFGVDQDAFEPLTGTYTYAFNKPGTFVYYCSIHGTASGKGMAGAIKVTR